MSSRVPSVQAFIVTSWWISWSFNFVWITAAMLSRWRSLPVMGTPKVAASFQRASLISKSQPFQFKLDSLVLLILEPHSLRLLSASFSSFLIYKSFQTGGFREELVRVVCCHISTRGVGVKFLALWLSHKWRSVTSQVIMSYFFLPIFQHCKERVKDHAWEKKRHKVKKSYTSRGCRNWESVE